MCSRRCVGSARWRRSAASTRFRPTLVRRWREQLLEAGAVGLAGVEQRSHHAELRKRIAELERALGHKTWELEIAGKLLPDGE